jgi:hypothetical protein
MKPLEAYQKTHSPEIRHYVLTVLPQIEALYEIHVAIDGRKALIAVLVIVLGQFFERERTIGGLVNVGDLTATVLRLQPPVESSPDHGQAEDRSSLRAWL